MTIRRTLLAASLLLLFGCQTPVPKATEKALTYTCDDGRTVQVAYLDTDTAVLNFDRQTHRLHTAISASGARYVGEQWQWWTKGMQGAWLAPLEPGEAIASASGARCTGS